MTAFGAVSRERVAPYNRSRWAGLDIRGIALPNRALACIRRILHHEDSFILDAGGFCVRRGHSECGEGDAIQAGNEQSNDQAAVEFHGDFSLTVMYVTGGNGSLPIVNGAPSITAAVSFGAPQSSHAGGGERQSAHGLIFGAHPSHPTG